MYQRFNKNTIESKFIKNLIATTYIPTVQVWKPGKVIKMGFTYITKNYIVKAVKDYTPADGVGPQSELDANYFDILSPYVRGANYPGLTSNYVSNTDYYDSKTHHYLGNYLRYQRDINDLDLMAYYNCWCGETSDNIRIKNINLSAFSNEGYTANLTETNNLKDGNKLLLVPIKYNTEYTIYINSSYPIYVGYIYSNGSIISSSRSLETKVNIINRCSYTAPYLFKGVSNLNQDNAYIYERYLTMILQLPESVADKVLVLEGDYTTNRLVFGYNKVRNEHTVNNIYNPDIVYGDKKSYIDNYSVDKYCKIVPGLTRKMSDTSFAFSDRLIEYLLLNVIDNMDSIYQNVERIQRYATSSINKEVNDSLYLDTFVKGE